MPLADSVTLRDFVWDCAPGMAHADTAGTCLWHLPLLDNRCVLSTGKSQMETNWVIVWICLQFFFFTCCSKRGIWVIYNKKSTYSSLSFVGPIRFNSNTTSKKSSLLGSCVQKFKPLESIFLFVCLFSQQDSCDWVFHHLWLCADDSHSVKLKSKISSM